MSWNDESVIDLTDADSSYFLADHLRSNAMNNVIINLDTDDSFNMSNNANARSSGRKRRKKTRGTVNSERPVNDLCTPTLEIKDNRRSRISKRASENTSITQEPTEEPKAKKAKKQNICCPICFEEFNGQPLAATKCGHVFCQNCIKLALKKKSQCPTCRTVLRGNPKFHPIFL